MGARLGQHFLLHARIAERIADSAGLSLQDTVLEVGPGKGILTRALLARAGRVVAVEADAQLAQELRTTFAPDIAAGRLALVEGDIRRFDTRTLEGEYRVVANIPYYLTGELFRHFLEAARQPASMTLLIQKEVAERVARSKKESILSLSVKAYGAPKYEFTVPRGAFLPVPKVDSAVLSIRDISRKHFQSAVAEQRFFALIHAGFAHKRKLLRGNLAALSVALPPSIPTHARAEEVPLARWLELAHTI